MKNQYVKYDKRVNCNGASLIIIGGQNSSTICVPSLGDTEVVLHNCSSIESKSSGTVITINGYPIDGEESTFSDKDFIGIDNIQIYYADGWLYFTNNLQIVTSFLTESIRESNNHLEYPQFYRSVRQLYTTVLEISNWGEKQYIDYLEYEEQIGKGFDFQNNRMKDIVFNEFGNGILYMRKM